MNPFQLIQSQGKEFKRDAQIILAHLLKVKPQDLVLINRVNERIHKKFLKLMEERQRGKPTAYIIGEWDFMSYTFKVKEGVLIPRPETEILVEKVLEVLPHEKQITGLEIGGGTGCISISLLLRRKNLKMYVTDVNPLAIELMEENAKLHKVEKRIRILEGDLFEPVKGQKFDFIVSNPPYIPASKWEELPKEVKMEGYTSVIGGEKGYEFYERIAKDVKSYLKSGGFLAFEIGHDQGNVVKDIFESLGFKIEVYKDYLGQDRVVLGWSC